MIVLLMGNWEATTTHLQFQTLDGQGRLTKKYCERDAKDIESIGGVFARLPELPVDGIYPMLKVDPEAYR